MTGRIERQIERFAPGFRDTILARHVTPPAALESHNPNLIGGDIGGGANTLGQVLLRPVPRLEPVHDAEPAAVPVFELDPTRRRRPRHVRLLGGPNGAQTSFPQRAAAGVVDLSYQVSAISAEVDWSLMAA